MWHLEGQHGRLQSSGLNIHVDLATPAAGADQIQFAGELCGNTNILGTEIRDTPAKDACPLADAYVRANDLVALYEEAAPHHVRQQVYWRAIQTKNAPATNGLELVVSVQTSLLDTNPTTLLKSRVLADQLVWFDVDLRPHTLGTDADTLVENPRIVLFRLPGSSWSYVEFVHPADFVSARLQVGHENPPQMTLSHELFTEQIEKGVIRRGRARGVFVPRENDQQAAQTCFNELQVSAPPLTV